MRWSVLIAGLLSSAPALADVNPPPEAWRIDPVRSEAGFGVRVLLLRKVYGEFHPLEGFVYRDPETGLADVEVRIDTRGLRMKNPDHAEWARSPEFFDAQHHPEIRFASAPFPLELLREGGPLYGTLTLRGVSAGVRLELLPADCARPGFDCPVRALGDVERSQFGMNARRYAVSDKVQLNFAILVTEGSEGAW
jgi:polyisoprenoid-binding protein YceI